MIPGRTWSGMISFASTQGMWKKLATSCAVAGVSLWELRRTETTEAKLSSGSKRRGAHGDRSPWILGHSFGDNGDVCCFYFKITFQMDPVSFASQEECSLEVGADPVAAANLMKRMSQPYTPGQAPLLPSPSVPSLPGTTAPW